VRASLALWRPELVRIYIGAEFDKPRTCWPPSGLSKAEALHVGGAGAGGNGTPRRMIRMFRHPPGMRNAGAREFGKVLLSDYVHGDQWGSI